MIKNIKIKIEEGAPGQVIIHLSGQPLEIVAMVEGFASTGEINRLRGKFVHIFGDAPQVAAFVWAVKPWLRWFTVNGVTVASPPHKVEEKDPV